MNPQIIIRSLSILTLLSNIAVVGVVGLFFLLKFKDNKGSQKLIAYLKDRALLFSFIVALTATLGSLYFSEGAGFAPCVLCWYQRIFMYPLVVILGVALWKKTKDIQHYVLPLSLIGMAIAAYHYKAQISPNTLVPCSTVGFSVSCSERFFTYYGYITIPWMSLSAFLIIGMLMTLFYIKTEK